MYLSVLGSFQRYETNNDVTLLINLWGQTFARLQKREILWINFREWPTTAHVAKNKLPQSTKNVYFAWNKLSQLVKFFLKVPYLKVENQKQRSVHQLNEEFLFWYKLLVKLQQLLIYDNASNVLLSSHSHFETSSLDSLFSSSLLHPSLFYASGIAITESNSSVSCLEGSNGPRSLKRSIGSRFATSVRHL